MRKLYQKPLIVPKVVQLDPDLHRRIKAHAAKVGQPIYVWVSTTLANAIKENK